MRRLAAACGLVTALCAPASGVAAVIEYVFEGYITDGGDIAGVFGNATSLTGLPIVVRTSFDTSVNRVTLPYQVDGVGGVGEGSALVSASLTVDGETFDLPWPAQDLPVENTMSLYEYFEGNAFNALWQTIYLPTANVEGALGFYLHVRLDSLLLPLSLDTPFDLTSADAASRFDGQFFVGSFDPLYQSDAGAGGDFAVTRAYARVAQEPAAVPEPATWAMLILGFAAAGAALRRSARRSVTGRPMALRP